jgi:uncharacterized protein (DUF433 family)
VNGGVAIDFYSCKGSINDILDRLGIIHTDPEIMSGSPVFVGTRVPLQTFFDYLEGESGLTEFLEDFPHLRSQAMKVLETQISSTS